MRSSNSDLITPPQSRDGPESIKSPMSVESVPSHDLMDTYQRIYDEEELAATEREPMSSSDGEDLDFEGQAESPSRAPRPSSTRSSRVNLQSMKSAPAEPSPGDADKENAIDESTGVLSQDSGMSFLAQLTDKDLAAKLTPHISDSARDKRRLQAGISARPISFHAGAKPSEFLADDARSNASSERSSRSSRRRKAHLGSPVINGVAKAYSDTSVETRSRASPAAERKPSAKPTGLRSPIGAQEPLRSLGMPAVDEEQPTQDPGQVNSSEDDGDETSAELKARERQFELNRARKLFGISGSKPSAGQVSDANAEGTFSAPQRQSARTDERVEDEPIDPGNDDFTQSSVRSNRSQGSESSVLRPSVSNRVPVTDKGALQKWARAAAEQRAERQSALSDAGSSQIDWLGAARDVPLPSLEADHDEASTDDLASLRQRPSIDRLKKTDNETTGMSFQVSESPPVKTKKSFDDIIREKEIDQLSRQAVTKSRLEAIRERDPREAHRRLSRSPSGTSLRHSISNDATRPTAAELETVGEQIPDTPVVIFRSSSGSSRNTANDKDRPQHDRQSSHDALQRFARLSVTPKSSPSITPTFEPSQSQAGQETARVRSLVEQMRPKTAPIAATPRVTGAWTDTILPPDTIGTVKPKSQPKYTETPHVKPGGWVDTPAPALIGRSSSAPEPVDEVTEDLTTDVVPQQAGALPSQEAAPGAAQKPASGPAVGQSALSNILAAQRARIASAPAAPGAGLDDTLNLGEATMASLEDLVDLNNEDVTTLIRLGAEHDALQQLGDDLALANGDQKEAEIVVLDRLTKKLNTLQTNIRHARRAVGRFEREMSEGAADAATAQAGSQPASTTQTLQAQPTTTPQPTQLHGTGVFPILYSTLTLPLPLLFHPTPPTSTSSSSTTASTKRTRKARSGLAKYLPQHLHLRLPGRPTPLLYLVLALLAYYFLEILLSEIYAHPLYAETYSWPTTSTPLGSPYSGGDKLAAAQMQVKGEPEFGLVLPTLLARVFGGDVDGGAVRGVVDGLWGAVGGMGTVLARAAEMVLGLGDGFAFDGGGQGGVAVGDGGADGVGNADASASGWEVGRRGDAGGWSIMNDEVL